MPQPPKLTPDVKAILDELSKVLDATDEAGRRACDAKCGVYAFFDYDDEPIYVGQTYERLRVRIRRHLSNKRTDAVAMRVLDPMEVARIEVWPFWDLEDQPTTLRSQVLNRAEFTVFQMLTSRAKVSRLLNEVRPASAEPMELPQSYSGDIIPVEIRPRLGHPDERISRRALTIAGLAQVIKERDVSLGLRETLVTQAERLEFLAKRRAAEVQGELPPEEAARETTRKGQEDDGTPPSG